VSTAPISSYVVRDLIFTDIPPGERDDVPKSVTERMAEAGAFPADKVTTVYRAILARERKGSTGIGRGIAIPHCKTSAVEKPLIGFSKPVEPIPYGATDGAPVHSLFVVVSPAEASDEHVDILRWIAGIARSDYYAKLLSTTRDPQSLFELFHEIDGRA
jgi:mannitol/fructose-specific phosphotransferase system IIA component (Ntr-type)